MGLSGTGLIYLIQTCFVIWLFLTQTNCCELTLAFKEDALLISEHTFFLLGNCTTEIQGSYDWPVDSLTCPDKYLSPVSLVFHTIVT